MSGLPSILGSGAGTLELSGSGKAGSGVGSIILPDEAGENAKLIALERAVVVSSVCRNRWRGTQVGHGKMVSRILLQNLMEFAVHARRFLDLAGLTLTLGEQFWTGADVAPTDSVSVNGRDVINKLIHHSSISVVAYTLPDEVDFCVFSFVRVTSDRGTTTFCPAALASAFIDLNLIQIETDSA
ncbi:MAG: hypothetical protein INF92_16495 [Rhodobacter sp.]|nr:hypothetical protein [Rhodobacter sp.]